MSDKRPETILVVDDNPATRYSTSRVLRGAGFELVEAENGLDAVRFSRRADLVVLDDRLEVVRVMRAGSWVTA